MNDYPIDMTIAPDIEAFFEPESNTISYVVSDPNSLSCAVIDSVMQINYTVGQINYCHANKIIDYIRSNRLKIDWIIETHVHADHLSGATYIKKNLGGKIAIGQEIKVVQKTFAVLFNEGSEFKRDGSQFDYLFGHGDTYQIGTIDAFTMHTPGHTPACMTHVIGNSAFIGDTLFMPDSGSARADFPGGNSGRLYDSIQNLLNLPDNMRLFMCHDYGPNGRAFHWESTVGAEKANNIHVGKGISRENFIAIREASDAKLEMPRLIIPSLQINMRAGQMPPKDKDGCTFLKLPINSLLNFLS
ncbi:hydroxyacylglutathione hydrolase [Candidatus Endolissoclinum faulkneri L5]|uniref:Hydroxyacylglutathione hydrolase n=1 Tax=Candidatus Endolissoclinum faulkneri L5 TaxID=1401328 RepID=V9TWX8_9PROT|nr:MBL fold metallo-hydrolase [Candidatus Endolissoclinum faulkneri]AHC73825.1 hydroxyacylglutathione hydrolase [Candidatus Endolissoclinum faulkneri L5]